jgi:hypothetical protein
MNSKTYTKISCKNEGFEMGVFKGFYERLQFHQLRINSLCYIFVVKQVLPQIGQFIKDLQNAGLNLKSFNCSDYNRGIFITQAKKFKEML